MNDKETVCYLLGAIGDVTKDEAVEALKNFTKLFLFLSTVSLG